METVGKQVVGGLGGPVGPVGPVGGDLHHHHHPHPHAHPPHPHPHPHGHPHGSHGHSLVGATSNPGRGQTQPPVSHNQHVSARSTSMQLPRPTQSYVNIKSSSPVSPRTVGTGATYVQGGAAASSAAAAAATAAATAGGPAVVAGVSTATSSGSNGGVVGVSNVLSAAAGGNSNVNNGNANNGGASNGGGGSGGGGGVPGGGGNVGGGGPGSGGPGSGNGSGGPGSGNNSGSGAGGGGGGAASGTPYVTVPSMLRYIHSYPPTSVSAPAVAAVVTTAPSPAAPVPAPAPVPPPSQPTVIASQTPPPPLTGTAYAARDAYRAGTTNVNERIAISVSNSPLSQVGVGVVAEYSGMGTGGRGDRPRISLLPPTGSSVTPISSPTASEYQQHTVAARNPSRIGLMPVQPDQYCTRTAVDMASLQQDTPPFKKIRLGQPHQQVQQLQSQPQSRCQSLSPADSCGGKQEQQQQHVVQLQQPLRIDTRPAVGAYTPQTEAISPTLPEPNTQEDALRSTKDELLQQIGKVDREIAKRENQLNMLRKRIKELEEAANKPLEASGLKRNIEEQSQQPKHQSLAQKIYAENRRKAEEAHRLMEKLGPKIELPLYNQPSDTNVYQENRTRHQTCMRTRLIARLRRDHTERASLHRQQTQTYTILVQEWHRKVERLEATQKRKSKETKNREFFEKVFPELRKQREDKERFNRVGARIKSEADLEEIMDGLQEQELEDKKMRSYAVIPPLLLDAKQRRIAFQNRNGLLQPEELEALHSERKLINVWSSVEHESFKEKYLQHPKNYGVIAQSLEHKSVPDCVHHYYLTKKTENYKQLLRKSRQRTRSSRNNPNNKVNNTSSTIGSIDILTTGVTTRLQREQQKTQENPIDILTAGITTRLQREQQQKTQENPQNSSVTATSTSTTSTTVTSSVSSTTVTTMTVTTTTTPLSSTASGVSVTADSTTASTTTTTTSVLSTTASSVSATTTSNAKDSKETSKENKENKVDSKESHLVKDSKEETQETAGKDVKVIIEGKGALSSSTSSLNINATNASTIQSDFKESSKKKPGCRDTSGSSANVATSSRIKDKKKENHVPMETSDEEAPSIDVVESGRQIGPHACTVCQSVVEGSAHSRALPRSQASQYGLREDQVPAGARVCNTCRCKAVRGRYTTCPLPGCPNLNSSKSRIKRLRALPSKWLDLPLEIREPIAQEFQIPNNATKCCSACFSRISRRLAPHLTGGTEASEDGADTRQWTDEELEQLRKALREYGTNWPKIAEQIPGKTSQQCKSYYFAYRKKLSFDQVVSEYYTLLGEERRPPYVTDEEESGSSTSSCDELAVHDSSDTASAGSPATTMTGTGASVIPSGGSTATSSLSFQRPSELGSLEKLGDKLADVAVVSLVPPAGSSQQSSSSGGAAATSGGAREDYDSSATETADEGQGGADLDNGNVVVTMTTASGNAASLQQQSQQQSQHQQPPSVTAHSPPSTTSNSNPLTVKDLMLGVIEMQLKRTPNSPADGGLSAPNSSGTPTISSILKSDHRNDITYVRGYKPPPSMTNTALVNRDSNLATLSVVSGPHHGHRSAPSPQQIGQMQATITPCPPAAPSSQTSSSDLLPKEGLVVMQVQQALRETEGTLDLSIKKPRLQQDYNHSHQLHKPPTLTLYRPEPPPGAYYHPHTTPHLEQGRNAKSPLVYASTPRPQASITPKMNKVPSVPQPHPKLSPKLGSMGTPGHKSGSITHGTPVSTARYEGLLRQMTPPSNPPVNAVAIVNERGGSAINASSTGPGPPKETGGGSITQGTPVLPFAVDKRGTPIYDYHRGTIRHSPVTGSGNVLPPPPGQGHVSQATSSAVVVSHSGSQYNSYSTAGRLPPNYTTEQQMSRQIIINDYYTSQQMNQLTRGGSNTGATVTSEMIGKSEPPPPPSSTLYYASTPPPPPQTHTQPRQGVIQRHNPQKQMHYPPQQHDALNNLVEVAIKQPTLPVPHPHGHPAASGSGGHEGLGKTMADRLLADRYDNNRAFREQEIRLQEHRMAEHRLAQHQRERERERDIVHLREKEEHRLHREKEFQQMEHRLVQQHHQHREKDFQQQEHRLAQREKDMHIEHRLQTREKDIQHEHRLIHQREKEIHQQMAAAAAQREKEHEHRLAVQQREKEIQQQEQRLAIQQQREKEIQQHEHRLAVQQARERDLVHLQQHQQQHMQQHIQQQRIEIERRQIAAIFRDQQLDRDSSRLLSSGFPQSSRLQQSQQSQHQQQQQSSRQSQSSQNDSSSTLTAASLIDAIITHQINQGVDNASGSSSSNQPTRAGDRLFQGFHRETPQEPNGIAHSPASEGGGGGASGNGSGCTKAMTLGEHVEHIISKDYVPSHSSYRAYGYPIPDDQWKRRKHNEPDSVKTGDERQIIRVVQQQQQQQTAQQQHQSSGKQQYHSVEPVSPPETTANHYGRRFYEPSTATSTSGTPSNKPHQISPFDYVKNKIVEVMRTEDDKAGGGGDNNTVSDRNGGGTTSVATEKDEKGGAGSVDRSPGGGGSGGGGSGGGEMVVDDAGGPPSREQPPPPAPAATTTFYPFSALGVHTGPPPAPPPTSATSVSVAKSEQMQAEPAPLMVAQYEPLSDED